MATRLEPDSGNKAVRFIERWKRGALASAVFGLAGVLPSFAAMYLAFEAADALGASPTQGMFAGALGLLVTGPLILGSRGVLDLLATLAKNPDDKRLL